MPLTWLQDYLERRRIRRNGNRRVLDERFGDPDITAPMAGGWNQLPVNPTTSGDQVLMGNEQDSNGKGSNIWMKCCFCDREDEKDSPSSNPQLPLTVTERASGTPNPSARNSGGPGFVYKPASERFFKEMAEIGKKSPTGVPGSNDSEKHRSKLSTISSDASFMDPVSGSDIPRHPSYHSQPRTASSAHTPVGSRSPCSTFVSSGDRQPSQTSPALSFLNTPSTAKQSSAGSIYLEPEKTPLEPVSEQRPAPAPVQPAVSTKQKKSRKKKRAVTEELVPSDEDLFG
ncbi:hypothetical protein AJ78_00092 [Emergomyces pasteurianus Ep9510]|uniref:Uncharacterized protein n=1 Tax=Emergomyces pasteurianus Ep9510 TaxID=1447872 RepID=A0A1J9PVH9_9EURO|nr:hypothetical protein AJ78_00092 [Emergomyces pasteurianus Ep9510]